MKSILCSVICLITFTCFSQNNNTTKLSGFYYVIPDASKKSGTKLLNSNDFYFIKTEDKVPLNDLDTVYKKYNDKYKFYNIDFRFNKKGAKDLFYFTSIYQGKNIGLVINDKLILAPIVREPVSDGVMELTGAFKDDEIERLVNGIENIVKENK